MDLVMMDRSLRKKRETDTAAAEIVANLTGPDPRIRALLPKALKVSVYLYHITSSTNKSDRLKVLVIIGA